MNKTAELNTTMNLVMAILEQDERTRNSDSFLYLKVLEHISNAKGIYLKALTVPEFLTSMDVFGFPCFETVRRTRQKIQREFPELSGNEEVKAFRSENEAAFRAFAISQGGGGE